MRKHRWTLGFFSDGSGVWLLEWRTEYERREWVPKRAKPCPWENCQRYPQYRGISKRAEAEVPASLARSLLSAWRMARKLRLPGWPQL